MSVSRIDGRVHACIDELLQELAPARLHTLIHSPLEKAAMAFALCDSPPEDGAAGDLMGVSGEFLKHLYATGVCPPRMLCRVQAEAEAAALLELFYEGMGGKGYDAALVDVTQAPDQCLPFVFDTLLRGVQALRMQERHQWILASLLDPLDWDFRVRVTEAFLQRASPFLPEEVADGPAVRFARCLPQLLLNYIDAQSELHHLLTAN